jgi:ABC-2 type transport system permease protein
MRALRLLVTQTIYATRGFLRNASAFVFTVVMPVVLLFLFNAIFHGDTRFAGHVVLYASYYTASIIAYQLTLAGASTLLISVTTDRERGLLKRFRGTPMPSAVYLASLIARATLIIAFTVVVLVLVGALGYHVPIHATTVAGIVAYTVVGTASMCALGLAATRVCATADAAGAFGPFSTVVLAFISGVFIPVEVMPHWLLDIGKVFPLEHLAHGLQSAFMVPNSSGISLDDLGVIALWGLGGLVVALRTFRWEPAQSNS